jgi:uncharacterized delta-60 repeat protein
MKQSKTLTMRQLADKLRTIGGQNMNESMRSSRRRKAGRRPGSLEQLESRVLLSAGSLDPTFSGDGKVTADFSGADTVNYDGSMALQADGKIVVVGTSAANFALARFNTDGTLDTSFDSDGKVTTDVSGTTSVMRSPSRPMGRQETSTWRIPWKCSKPMARSC